MQYSMIPGWFCHQNQRSKSSSSPHAQSISHGLGLAKPNTAQHASAVVVNAE